MTIDLKEWSKLSIKDKFKLADKYKEEIDNGIQKVHKD